MTIGLLVSWIAHSQSIKADKKIDSFYCFGPNKAKELAKMQAENQINDSVKAVMKDELDMCKYVFGEYQIAYQKCTEAENIAASQLQHKDVQIEAKSSENAGLKKELRKAKQKTIFANIVTSVSIAGNIILGIKLASK